MVKTNRRAIDYHCNLMTPEAIHYRYLEEGEKLDSMAPFFKAKGKPRGYQVDEFVRLMDELGIEKGVCPAWQWCSFRTGQLLWDESPELIYEKLVKPYPGRFYGLMGINPRKRMEGVRQLERVIKEYGFLGAHLHTHGFGLPLNHRDYFPFYAKLAELDAVLVAQVGIEVLQPGYGARPILLDDIALYFPNLRIVASHTGYPWVEEAISMAYKYPNVFIGTASYTPKYWSPNLVHFINSYGKGKVMWGTSYVAVDHRKSLEEIDQLGLRDDAKDELLYGTAARVFRI